MNTITANELKTKGVTLIEQVTSGGSEAFVSVRGKNRFVILPLETYNHLRECELEAALIETKKDLKAGKFVKETAEKHIKRISRG